MTEQGRTAVLIAVAIFAPMVLICCLETLLGITIALTFETWLAALVIILIFNITISVSR